MGKKSTKENKNIYQLMREECGYTREKASDIIGHMSADRIEKIESEKSLPRPDEILALANCYRAPELCNHFCSNECPIGEKYIPEVKSKDLSKIILEVVAALNSLEEKKNRLIEITVDGQIDENEYDDFVEIRNQLTNISTSVDALRIWFEKTVAEGKLPANLL